MSAVVDAEDRHLLSFTARRRIVLVSGRGSLLFDADGRSYIDCSAGHGVASLGHGSAVLRRALRRQAARLVTCPASFYNDARAALLVRLAGLAPPGLDRAFLCSSGAEAVEAALKLARLSTGRSKVVCALRGFHGRTMGALSATHSPRFRRGLGPLVPGFSFVPFNRPEALVEAVSDDTAAVLLEPVQGEGGVHVATAQLLEAARAACYRHGALLILDEVQTGFCRTGSMLALDHYGVVPDLLCLAKGMAAGVPAGAVLAGPSIVTPAGAHGSTFGGNPLACAVAEATIAHMQRTHLAEQVARKGRYLLARLRSLRSPVASEVRGLGLMVGVQLTTAVAPVLDRLAALGVLALPAGPRVLRLLPPLTIPRPLLGRVVDAIREALDA